MNVSFKLVKMLTTDNVYLKNVIWVRLTENKVIIECQDTRHYEYRLKNLLDFEVIH